MTDNHEDEPLDPAVEAIRVKLVRLLMVSGGIMMVGLMTVVGVIVYKVNGGGTAPAASSALVAIPKGGTILSASSTEDGLLLTIRRSDGSTIIRRHNAAGQLIATYTVIEE